MRRRGSFASNACETDKPLFAATVRFAAVYSTLPVVTIRVADAQPP